MKKEEINENIQLPKRIRVFIDFGEEISLPYSKESLEIVIRYLKQNLRRLRK